MQFDKGHTTFDLQDTEFHDKYELFDKIKHSDLDSRYERAKRALWEDWNEELDLVYHNESIESHTTE